MFTFDLFWFIDSILVFALAFLIDVVFGEYPDTIHPTIGIGKIISHLKSQAKSDNPHVEKANGIFLAVIAVLVVTLPVFALLFWLRGSFGWVGQALYVIIGAILFKATFAVK